MKNKNKRKNRTVNIRLVVDELLSIVRTEVQSRNLRCSIPWQAVCYFQEYKSKFNDILQITQESELDYEITALDTQTAKTSNFI